MIGVDMDVKRSMIGVRLAYIKSTFKYFKQIFRNKNQWLKNLPLGSYLHSSLMHESIYFFNYKYKFFFSKNADADNHNITFQIFCQINP